MSAKGANIPAAAPAPANVRWWALDTNQQAIVIPWFFGEQLVKLQWIGPVYGQYTVDVPTPVPAKK